MQPHGRLQAEGEGAADHLVDCIPGSRLHGLHRPARGARGHAALDQGRLRLRVRVLQRALLLPRRQAEFRRIDALRRPPPRPPLPGETEPKHGPCKAAEAGDNKHRPPPPAAVILHDARGARRAQGAADAVQANRHDAVWGLLGSVCRGTRWRRHLLVPALQPALRPRGHGALGRELGAVALAASQPCPAAALGNLAAVPRPRDEPGGSCEGRARAAEEALLGGPEVAEEGAALRPAAGLLAGGRAGRLGGAAGGGVEAGSSELARE
mmetsp:Transcript_41059/g.124448  ORF Transcript_41059/g.124448 Transcript_41059/m.124448 type:complete len:267 (+) Transcript_41059:237-1037(+)